MAKTGASPAGRLEVEPATRTRAVARFVRSTPTKVRQVAQYLRGCHVVEAQHLLRLSPKAAAEPLRKALESAIANAEHNNGLDPDELVVSEIVVEEGPTLRRFRPRAMGRATRIRKRTSHLTVEVAVPRLPEAGGGEAAEAGAGSSRRRSRRGGGATRQGQQDGGAARDEAGDDAASGKE